MLQGSVSTMVDATPDHIWRVLISRIDTPALNSPDSSDLKILLRNGEALLRERTFGGESYTERINIDNSSRRVVYTLIEHPYFEGYISEQILRTDSTNVTGCILAFTVDWKLRDEVDEPELPDLLGLANDELFQVKDFVEQEVALEAQNIDTEPQIFAP